MICIKIVSACKGEHVGRKKVNEIEIMRPTNGTTAGHHCVTQPSPVNMTPFMKA